MSIRALITEGIGPGGSVLYAITLGLDLPIVPPPPSGYIAKAVQIDATSVLSGLQQSSPTVADSALFTLSAWFNVSDITQFPSIFFAGTPTKLEAGVGNIVGGDGSTGINFQFWDGAFADELFENSISGVFNNNTWVHIFVSVDTNHAAGLKLHHLFVNGIEVGDGTSLVDTSPAFSISYTETNGYIFIAGAGGTQGLARYADVQIWVGQLIDPTVPANLAKFISGGCPVDPAAASAAFGTPTFFFTGGASTFPTNKGTGGAFTIVGNAPTDYLGPCASPISIPLPLPPLPPFVQGPLPHDDYYYREDGYRAWYQRPRDQEEKLKLRLDAMRREIGLLPPLEAKRVEAQAEKQVKKAALAITEKLDTIGSEKSAFDLVASQEREYRRTFRSVLAKARAEDLREEFRSSVRAEVERQARARRLARDRDDADVLTLLSFFV